jgi:hypothetical protein
MIYLPLSKSTWIEGRIGPEKYQDYFLIVKKSINLLKNKSGQILLLSDFKSKQAKNSELENMINICKSFNVNESRIIVKKYGYDTLSQIEFSLDLCKETKNDILIISSLLHYPRVRWITYRINKKYNIYVEHKMALGIPRVNDLVFDIVLMFVYPVIDMFGYSEKFTNHMKIRRDKGYLL